MGIIETKHLVKEFDIRVHTGDKVRDFFYLKHKPFRAVDNVSLEIKEGEIFGLLGPNGAGKTTLTKLLTGLIAPTSGTVLVEGMHPENALQKMGVMFGYSMIYYRMSGYDNLKYFAKLYGVRDYRKRIRELSDFLGLGHWINDLVERYSLGMKSKLSFARALIHDPDILFLDEPTLGLDPKISREVRKEIKSMGKTVMITTHYMDEANELCDRIGIIRNGKLITVDTPENLKKLVEKGSLVEVGLKAHNEKLVCELTEKIYVQHIDKTERGLEVLLRDRKYLRELLTVLSKYEVVHVSEKEPTLVDVFIKLTGESYETC